MLEEAKELSKAKSRYGVLNELSDISELTDTLLREYNFSKSEFRLQQRVKRKKRGGLQKSYFWNILKNKFFVITLKIILQFVF